MELKGEQVLPLPRERVWAALNDPEILKASVPGCEAFERVGDNEFQIVMAASVGPVKARFKGKMTLSDLKPPQSYSLAFEGSGGAAGFGKGGAHVELEEDGAGTKLVYTSHAQEGSRLLRPLHRRLAGSAGRNEQRSKCGRGSGAARLGRCQSRQRRRLGYRREQRRASRRHERWPQRKRAGARAHATSRGSVADVRRKRQMAALGHRRGCRHCRRLYAALRTDRNDALDAVQAAIGKLDRASPPCCFAATGRRRRARHRGTMNDGRRGAMPNTNNAGDEQ
jgi:carbon monoxide dehydrogenase subunit G